MNSHQSLAEALETCKYTENFTSHGARSCSRDNPPRKPTRQQRKTLFHVQQHLQIRLILKNQPGAAPTHPPPPRIEEHNTATSEVTYSCVYQQFTTCNRETESSTVHKSCRSIQPRECSKQEMLCNRWVKKKTKQREPQHSSHTERQIYTRYNLAKSGRTQSVKGWKDSSYAGVLIFLIHPLTHFEDEEEGEQNFL